MCYYSYYMHTQQIRIPSSTLAAAVTLSTRIIPWYHKAAYSRDSTRPIVLYRLILISAGWIVAHLRTIRERKWLLRDSILCRGCRLRRDNFRYYSTWLALHPSQPLSGS